MPHQDLACEVTTIYLRGIGSDSIGKLYRVDRGNDLHARTQIGLIRAACPLY
jgi:hypothetical protein